MKKEELIVYNEAKLLFNNKCAYCGRKKDHMHHIRFGGQYGRKTYRGNIIPLCYICHIKAHNNKDYYMDLFIRIIDSKLDC